MYPPEWRIKARKSRLFIYFPGLQEVCPLAELFMAWWDPVSDPVANAPGWLFSWGILLSDGLLSILASAYLRFAVADADGTGPPRRTGESRGFHQTSTSIGKINNPSIDAKWLGKMPLTTRTYLRNLLLPFMSFSFVSIYSKGSCQYQDLYMPNKWMRGTGVEVLLYAGFNAAGRGAFWASIQARLQHDSTMKYCCFNFHHSNGLKPPTFRWF